MAENEELNNTEEFIDNEPVNEAMRKETQTLESVGKDLSELLTNSVNMADRLFEIFFDPVPHIVDLELYDREGRLHVFQIPNRAMDRNVAKTGEGGPEGNVEGAIGDLYIDMVSRDLYIKKVAEGTIGWVNITPKGISVFTEEFTYDPEIDTHLTLGRIINYPEHLMVFANGMILTPPPEIISDDETASHEYDYSLGEDRKTLYIYKELPIDSTIFIRYLDGLNGLKGDTALRMSVGSTVTLNPDEPADVCEELVDLDGPGNGQEIVLHFRIPRGETGNTGVYIGETEPEDPEQLIWLDTSADGTSEADFAGMRIWDSGVCSSARGYDKVYELKHSIFNIAQVEPAGTIELLSDGTADNFIDGSIANYVRIPFEIGNLAGKSWLISGRCKLGKPHASETPIILFGEGPRLYGSIFARPTGFCFAARTGGLVDNDPLHDNQGVKLQIYYEFPDEPQLYQYELQYHEDEGLYTFAIYDQHKQQIGHKYWQGPAQIIKNGEIIDLHNKELICISTNPTWHLTIGAHLQDNESMLNRHNGDEHYLEYLSIMIDDGTGHLESAFSTNDMGTDTLVFPNHTTVDIPYYNTITGAKVIDFAYKDIVEEYYVHTGKGCYYAIDEKHKTFMLPHPDLYGLIGSLQRQIDELKQQINNG